MDQYHGKERRSFPLSDDQIEIISTAAAKKALDMVYAEVGKNVLKKLAWITGVVVIGLFMFLAAKGSIPWGKE